MSLIKIKNRPQKSNEGLSFPCSALLKQLYANRGIINDRELDNSTKTLLDPKQLKGIDAACELLYRALKSTKRLIVVGDFDADGATSTALSIIALKALGFTNIDYLVPNRFDYGYGLTPEVVDLAITKGAQVIMTVDNGISSVSGVNHANNKGVQVLVTDHHLPGNKVPNAAVIVNPNQHACTFESKNLAGVGVAFYIMLAMRSFLINKKYFTNQTAPNLASLLDIVALGTVADVVILDKNNRILVYQGLARIRADKCRPGISALIKVAKCNQKQLVASDLGFALAPRLNAAGRLDEMSSGVELLLCNDTQQADILAEALDTLNRSRREIEQGMQDEALKILKELSLNENNIPYAICLFDPDWHQGIIGLVASRIKERYYRPTFIFAQSKDGEIKGSARSISGVNIRDILDLVDKKIPGAILKFGGHAMAAGLSLAALDFKLFEKTLNNVLESQIEKEVLTNIVLSDGTLSASNFSLKIAQELRDAGPWGQGFDAPLFDGQFNILQQRLVGGKHLKLVLSLEMKTVDAIAFNVDLNIWPNASLKLLHCVYCLDINEYRGKCTLQMVIEKLSPILP
ncbi:MAG: single-stranded-DNA-specific exonuclease RecJ [Psychromonas sp.]|nr:single-stranded-DNA-specific exonuclease RecJ [Psychromonas sp.]